ncbi:MDIS1-interacting receptor like kinase 2-like [Arachis stenosperma]|uniref:MDIS1-interacting receptor like kinase 2-like n=1 Tax=Arachis stenosperma TaxID=217475 RepID=UPI0025ABA790|nr:MDIS1-interacting receptor like kinase 2-like [Arachis stenosperma]
MNKHGTYRKHPKEISTLTKLSYLDMFHNNLHGVLHKELAAIWHINLSYNSFNFSQEVGMKSELPEYCSFKEDSLIGCNTPDFRSCHYVSQTSTIKHLIIIAVPVTCIILIFTILAILLFARRTKNIIEATQDFDIRYCIGTGGYGSVYRAQLPSGKVVALKKLHQLESQNPSFDKSFRNEVKIGSLLYALRMDDEAEELSWSQRVNILSGTVQYELLLELCSINKVCSLIALLYLYLVFI